MPWPKIEGEKKCTTWKEMKVDTHLIETLQKRLIADAQVITLS